MSSDLIEQLRRLQQGFSALCSSYAAADALIDEARGFRQAALHYTGHAQPAEASRWACLAAAPAAAATLPPRCHFCRALLLPLMVGFAASLAVLWHPYCSSLCPCTVRCSLPRS